MPSIFINPTPLLSKVERPHSLSERVNITTRSLHTQLNRLILVRLPLALPPKTTNPSRYVSGLLHIAPIYATFESLWQTILDTPLEEQVDGKKVEEAQGAIGSRSAQEGDPATTPPRKIDPRLQSLLSDLYIPGLPRAETIQTDIKVLTATSERRVQEQLHVVAQHGRLAKFLSHIEASIEAKPHVLLAYAWVLYMALFSGGRHLRAELNKAGGVGPDFWDREPSPVRPYSITQEQFRRRESRSAPRESDSPDVPRRARSRSDGTASLILPGMQFFHFAGSEDGEDIKRRFKTRYAEAELQLTEAEKDDIVTEAHHIFSYMLELVADLDLIMQAQDGDIETELLLHQSRPLSACRDSVSVTHERFSRRRPSNAKECEDPSKSSLLGITVPEPLVKLSQFKGAAATWDLVMTPLGRRFSKEGPSHPQVSFSPEEQPGKGSSSFLIEHYMSMLIGLLSVLVALLAWYNSS